jgi:hypothetical protein
MTQPWFPSWNFSSRATWVTKESCICVQAGHFLLKIVTGSIYVAPSGADEKKDEERRNQDSLFFGVVRRMS